MKAYLDIVKNILENGKWKKPVRRNTDGSEVVLAHDTIALPNQLFSHNMADGFPLLTTKKMPFKSMLVELEGFIKGITSKKWYQERGCKFWNEWGNPQKVNQRLIDWQEQHAEEFENGKAMVEASLKHKLDFQLLEDDLGPLGYSWNWRYFGKPYPGLQKIQTNFDKKIFIQTDIDDDLIGSLITGKYGEYVVISYDGRDKYYNKRYSVKFRNTGFVKNNLNKKQITDKNVYDPYFPNICNIACIGIPKSNLSNDIIEKLKLQWRAMIHRCYNVNCTAYDNYGGRGVYVDDRWLIFENYLDDIQRIDGWQNKILNWRIYELDKDIKGLNFYSAKSCIWVNKRENLNFTQKNYFFDAISPSGVLFKNNLGLSRFCSQHNLKTKNVEASIKNDTFTHNGWKFIRKSNYSNKHQYNDQLKEIVNRLHNNPYDRRMVCSAWNPNQIDQMALPPCHYAWNVTVIGDEINLFWAQRSCDLMLGVPVNISSYATLLMLLAKESGFKPGNLSGMLVDCHIYSNQIEPAKMQIQRKPSKLPELEILNKEDGSFSVFDWCHTDVKLTNYNPQDKIDFGDVTV